MEVKLTKTDGRKAVKSRVKVKHIISVYEKFRDMSAECLGRGGGLLGTLGHVEYIIETKVMAKSSDMSLRSCITSPSTGPRGPMLGLSTLSLLIQWHLIF